MRLHFLSDLHLERAPFEPPAIDADVVVLAGDLHPGLRGVEWAAERWPDRPVVYVPGNHEYYGRTYPRLVREMRERASQLGVPVHVLSDSEVTLDGVRFLGATLWTDFELLGTPHASALVAREQMTDFRSVQVEPGSRRCLPSDTVAWHRRTRRWLADRLADAADGPSVVVTHHAPSQRSVNPLYTDAAAAAYASHLDDLVAASGAALWLHGHTHHCVEYTLGATRVLSNQRGYPDEEVGAFDPAMVVEVG